MSHPSATLRPPTYGAVTLYSRPRRRSRLRIVLALLLIASAGLTVGVRQFLQDDSRRRYLAADGWPSHGQAAYQLGDDDPHKSPGQSRAPIASMAKVMTAYLVLRQLPLASDTDGPTLTVTDADVADTAVRRSQEQSLVDVSAGEELTERQALMAMLLPSANNVAVMLARFTAGSVKKFVSRMNAMAAALGMWDTNYTDPSGFDDRTSSTASDQLILARVAVHDEVLADMMATRTYRLPVAGTVQNTDTLLGKDGFVGMKTGSDDAAGGCFMFLTHRVINGKTVDMVGVVMGQPGHNLIHAGLYAARQLANRTAPVAADD
jgi:D-alanyl-D-alanine carboxypeptidase (penicillin-binding protein 5/6)